MKKYELTSETKMVCGITLHRIRALIDIKRWNVKSGDMGGWIESEANLDQSGEAWVSGEALVFGEARVSDEALVFGEARVSDEARVFGEARVSKCTHMLTVGRIGSRNDITTFFQTRSASGFAISVSCGCFYGTVAEFRREVAKTHGDNKHGRVYQLAADLAEAQIELDVEAQ